MGVGEGQGKREFIIIITWITLIESCVNFTPSSLQRNTKRRIRTDGEKILRVGHGDVFDGVLSYLLDFVWYETVDEDV